MVGEMVEGVLDPAGRRPARLLDRLSALVLESSIAIRCRPISAPKSGAERASELASRLDQIGLHPPKRVIDIPEHYVASYFDMMPFDKELLTNDVPTTLAYLQLTLSNIRDELVKRMDAAGDGGPVARSG